MKMKKTLNFSDVLILPKPTSLNSRAEVNLEVSYLCKHSKSLISGIPVIVANMSCVGTIAMAKALCKKKLFVLLHKFIKDEELISFFKTEESKFSFYTLGSSDEEFERFKNIYRKCLISKVALEVANGYMYSFLDRIKQLRDYCPNVCIMAGNVCTPEGVENIIDSGADLIKCGISGGSFCKTRNKAGIGLKQFTCAVECSQAARELGALCVSDGGVKECADICKALGSGSHFVVCGGLFAGYDECESEWEKDSNGNKTKMFMYGMSSKYANDKFNGGLKEYRTSEGAEGWVEYKGKVDTLLQDITGSLASCCTYTNTKNLIDLYKNCQFVN